MDDLRKYYLELASRVCEGITPDHYDRWIKWAKENGLLISPWMFISSITSLSVEEVSERISPWHMEHGKRVEDEYEKIKIV
ncbi:MAG: hypothetical protein ACTH9S_10635 [Lactococcus lactis]